VAYLLGHCGSDDLPQAYRTSDDVTKMRPYSILVPIIICWYTHEYILNTERKSLSKANSDTDKQLRNAIVQVFEYPDVTS